MRRVISTLIVCLITISLANAVRATGIPTVVNQADGTWITIIVRGDEYCRYTTTIDNYQIVEQKGVYYYWTENVTKSTKELVKANDPTNRSWAEHEALRGKIQGRISPATSRSTLINSTFTPLAQATSGRVNAVRFQPRNVLVILAQFQDVKFQPLSNISSFNYLLNSAPKSAQQYFADNSKGAYIPQFDISPVVTLPHNMAYYGANSWNEQMGTSFDIRPQEMVRDACLLAATNIGSFTKYDNNADGYLDNVYILFAGHNEAEGGSQNTIWPHQWAVAGSPTIAGVRLSSYTCGSELSGSTGNVRSGIGTFCHEFSHVLGLPDFYDTNYEVDGLNDGLYNLSLMGSGNYNDGSKTPPYFNAYERHLLGWNTLNELKVNVSKNIRPIQDENNSFFFSSKVSPDEFYVVEYRNGSRGVWDAPIASLYGVSAYSGMLIYHIDISSNESGAGIKAYQRWQNNTINCNATHPCMQIINSSQSTTSQMTNILFPGSTAQTSFTGQHKGGVDWRGNPIMIELIDIKDNGSTMSFSTRSSQGTGEVLSFITSQRSTQILFSTTIAADRFILNYKMDNDNLPWNSVEAAANTNRVAIKGLLPDTRYRVEFLAVTGQTSKLIAKSNFITTPLTAPFAAIEGLNGGGYYAVGESLTLSITNLNLTPSSITFAMDGMPIEENKYVFNKKGNFTLSCTINYSEQNKEIITRKIIVQ